MFKFRGQRKDNGEWVVGNLVVLDDNSHGIVNDAMQTYAEIHPHTLSISTGKPDSKGEEIFASFPIDGVMTEGGDVVELGGLKFNITYSLNDSGFAAILIDKPHGNYYSGMRLYDSTIFTIIGKQGGKQ